MKRAIFILFTGILFYTNSSQACDACGCSTSMSYLGIVPMTQNHLIGLRYNFQSFDHPITSVSSSGEGLVLQDRFHTTEIWGRYSANERLHIFYSIPYRYNQRVEENGHSAASGIGDIQLMANYNLIIQDVDTANWKHFLRVGLHTGLPTGKFMQRDPNKAMYPLWFQVGTGSWGFGLQTFYTVRYKKVGLNTNVRWTYLTQNELDYQPGSRLVSSLQGFYWLNVGRLTLLPQIGVNMEHFEMDQQYEADVIETGGTRMSTAIGLDMYLDNALISIFASQPFWQNIPDEQPAATPNIGFSVAYYIN